MSTNEITTRLENGRYAYRVGNGIWTGPAIPVGKSKEDARAFARERFRYMLANEAGGGMGMDEATRRIEILEEK